MKNSLRALDRILRGDATRLPLLREGSFDIPVRGLLGWIVIFGMITGACMGVSAVITHWNAPYSDASRVVVGAREDGFKQLGASVVKVPMLFVLTLLITFPSLYVFNALVGSRLTMGAMLRLLVAAMSVMLTVLVSFGPIVAFFAVSTTSYPFMKLLNVIVFAIAGLLGLAFLMQTLHRLTLAQEGAPPVPVPPPAPVDPAGIPPIGAGPYPPYSPAASGALDRATDRPPTGNVKLIFRIWVFVFALVGAQMAWVLRPFIGDPTKAFSFFRARDSNFFQGVLETIGHLFGWSSRW